jgi:hypothetical protein
MGSDEDRPANLYERSHRWLLPIVRSDLIHRPGDGTSHRADGRPSLPELVSSPSTPKRVPQPFRPQMMCRR